MQRFTVSISNDLAEWVESQADERGVSKAKVMRDAVESARTGTVQSGDTGPVQSGATSPVNDDALRERVAELEARVDALEERDQDADRRDRDDEGARDGAAPTLSEESAARVSESEADFADGNAVALEAGTSESDDVLEEVLDGWRPGRTPGEKREQQRAAGRAALTYLREEGVATAAEFREHIEPQYPVEGQSAATWWKNTARPALKRAQEAGLVKFVDGNKEWHYVGADEA